MPWSPSARSTRLARAQAAGADGGTAQAGGARRNRPTVVVHADMTFLAGGEGGAELDVMGPVSREVARRLACDAKVLVSADGADGRSLNLGRTRRDPSDAQRLEIRRRDKGCRFPGCTHTEFTDVHHVRHWIDGGPTDLDNLVELCDQHHRCVHEMGWKISGNANVELTFKSPTGRRSTSTPFSDPYCSERRTAWLIASCSATFCARPGTMTRTSDGVGVGAARASFELRQRRDLVHGQSEPARDRADVAGRWRAEELLEHGRLDRSRLRQEGEDPSPAVVEHDERAR